jgi:cation transport regulator ChaC
MAQWDKEAGVWVGNKAWGDEEVPDPLWIFGYGSLCWKTEFAVSRSCSGVVRNWRRLFWQASMDHRGTPAFPGRTVTMLEDRDLETRGLIDANEVRRGGTVHGVAYLVAKKDSEAVLANLDFREKGGYTRTVVEVILQGGEKIRALLYTGNCENPNFVAEQDTQALASTIAQAHGPSGANSEYLFKLADFLRSVGADDDHVFELEAIVKQQASMQSRVIASLQQVLNRLQAHNRALVATAAAESS